MAKRGRKEEPRKVKRLKTQLTKIITPKPAGAIDMADQTKIKKLPKLSRVERLKRAVKRITKIFAFWLSFGIVAYFAIINSVEKPKIISPVVGEYGNPTGLRLIPLSHPDVAVASEPKREVVKVDAPEDVRKIVEKYFEELTDEALTCFKSESGLRPSAINYSNRNGSWDIGLAQINTVHCPKVGAKNRQDCVEKLLDLETNVKIADQIHSYRGFNAWYGKSCRQFWK